MKLQDLKSKIPFGGVREIAKRAKVNEIALGQYFSGAKRMSVKKELQLIKITLEYLKELKAEREGLQKELKQLLQ